MKNLFLIVFVAVVTVGCTNNTEYSTEDLKILGSWQENDHYIQLLYLPDGKIYFEQSRKQDSITMLFYELKIIDENGQFKFVDDPKSVKEYYKIEDGGELVLYNVKGNKLKEFKKFEK